MPSLMTPADLRALGDALYGSRWKSELARALGIHLSTLRDWTSGYQRIPAARVREIRALAERRVAAAIAAIGEPDS